MSELPGAFLRLEHEVAGILAGYRLDEGADRRLLAAIGSSLGWDLGAIWEVSLADGCLRCVDLWHMSEDLTEFEELSESLVLRPGFGLPGRVAASGVAEWVVDLPDDANFPRADAARNAGLQAALAFPLRGPAAVVGVIEFFARDLREPSKALLDSLEILGSQVGQLVARRQAEVAVAESESRLRAMLDSSLDAIVAMSHEGIVTGWNPAAERIFGYPATEAIGRKMGELIVPPSFRGAHDEGIQRYVETETAHVLDRRIELVGMRADGSEFPVELTITRIALPGPPQFTGYIRDITERKQADAALRASRARLVQVADAERRRIQRNLHDGAQQRLTAVVLALGRLRESVGTETPLLDSAIDELAAGLQELRELASGLHPSVLTERGLGGAVAALALRAPIEVEVVAVPHERLPEPIEAAAYFVVAEALANVQKHARARSAEIAIVIDQDRLIVDVRDNGVGGARIDGDGLRSLADRVEALGGDLVVEGLPAGGTSLRATLPTR
jgi:PAS domain S-box-containing protein